MIVSVFRRRLKEGKTFDDFLEAWGAEEGFGVPTRVFNAARLDDEREILTFAFVDIEAEALGTATAAVADQEAARHSRIDDVIESTELRAFYDLLREDDLSGIPREVQVGTEGSLLSALGSAPS
jgi:hypothetical protein